MASDSDSIQSGADISALFERLVRDIASAIGEMHFVLVLEGEVPGSGGRRALWTATDLPPQLSAGLLEAVTKRMREREQGASAGAIIH